LAYKLPLEEQNPSIASIKKALTPMFMLALLEVRPMYVSEMVSIIEKESEGAYSMAYPYDIVYRLTENDYMIPVKKAQIDGRRRQLYTISDKGKDYLLELKESYDKYMEGIENIWRFIDISKQNGEESGHEST